MKDHFFFLLFLSLFLLGLSLLSLLSFNPVTSSLNSLNFSYYSIYVDGWLAKGPINSLTCKFLEDIFSFSCNNLLSVTTLSIAYLN